MIYVGRKTDSMSEDSNGNSDRHVEYDLCHTLGDIDRSSHHVVVLQINVMSIQEWKHNVRRMQRSYKPNPIL